MIERLTPTERALIRLAADGLTHAETAQRLHYSTRTVRNYWQEIHRKLGTHTKTQAVVLAIVRGDVSLLRIRRGKR